jgi:hypothetical protein
MQHAATRPHLKLAPDSTRLKHRTKLTEIGGGDGGGKAVGRREGKQHCMLRTQCRAQHVTEAARLRIVAFKPKIAFDLRREPTAGKPYGGTMGEVPGNWHFYPTPIPTPFMLGVVPPGHDDRAFRPMLGCARAASPPCGLGSPQNRQQRGGGRAGGASPPCALGSSQNRQRREGGSRFLRFLEPGVGRNYTARCAVNIRGDRVAAPGHNMLIARKKDWCRR